MAKIVDYTKLRLSAKNRIVKCPRCGRNGLFKKYVDGSAAISHVGRIEMGFLSFDSEGYCHFAKWEPKKGGAK